MKVTKYRQLGKHRKKCHGCGKLIQDGEEIIVTHFTKEKLYPVKGIMRFTTYHLYHPWCIPAALNKK